jgi:hypothetical protein
MYTFNIGMCKKYILHVLLCECKRVINYKNLILNAVHILFSGENEATASKKTFGYTFLFLLLIRLLTY